jgi:glycogen debranching enzyme
LRSEAIGAGVRIHPEEGEPFQVLSAGGRWWVPAQPRWRTDIHLAREAERGLACRDAHLLAATVQVDLSPEHPCLTLVASTDAAIRLDGEAVLAERIAYEERLLERWRGACPEAAAGAPAWIRQLVLAADQFLVQRRQAGAPQASGRSIIAGYPWFDDWGRDTMIALPGLTLATGRGEEAAAILRTYAAHVDRGMLPNCFPGEGRRPDPRHDYNTVDAALWFFQAVRAAALEDDRDDLLRELYPCLAEILTEHREGSRCGIGMDPRDGLLRAGEGDSQLTWMDARHDGRSVTPRIGKPVEVNALWHGALTAMAAFAARLDEDPTPYRAMAERTRAGFARFWCEERGHCFDVLDGPDGAADASLRPNQLLALSLPDRLLPPRQERSVLRRCARHLLTSHGLRSLDPLDPRYRGRYAGDRAERDEAYHQGTVWAWWMGPFVLAHARLHGDPEGALSFLEPFAHHLQAAGLGSISEIFDGDPPHAPRGCIAQAWSVAEVLRSWTELRRPRGGD